MNVTPTPRFGAANVELNKDKLRSMSYWDISPRLYLRMKDKFRTAEAYLAEPKVQRRLDVLSSDVSIRISGTSNYETLNCRPYLQARIEVVDPETRYPLPIKLSQRRGETAKLFLRRVLTRTEKLARRLGLEPSPPSKTDDKRGPYTFK